MDYFDSDNDLNVSSSLNASVVFHSHNNTEHVSAEALQITASVHHTTRLEHTPSASANNSRIIKYESGRATHKSNLSIKSNIQIDSHNNSRIHVTEALDRSHTSEPKSLNETTPKVTNLNLSKQKLFEVSTCNTLNQLDKPVSKALAKPPSNLNPHDRLANLHRRVDDLLSSNKKIRDSSADNRPTNISATISDRPQRASSTDHKPTAIQNFSYYTPVKKNSFHTQNGGGDLLSSGRSCLSIDLDREKTQEHHLNVTPVQIREKSHASPTRSRPAADKSMSSLQHLPSHFEANNITRGEHERTIVNKSLSHLNESRNRSFDHDLLAKPRYDPHKLDAIISRIRGNGDMISQTPAVKKHSLSNFDPYKNHSAIVSRYGPESGRRQGEEFSTRREERFLGTSNTWHLSGISRDENTMMDEMVGEFDDFLPNRLNPVNESISRRRGHGSPNKRDKKLTQNDLPKNNIIAGSDSQRSQRVPKDQIPKEEEQEASYDIKITNLSEVLKNRPFDNLSVIREQHSNSNSKSVSMRKLEFSAERPQKSLNNLEKSAERSRNPEHDFIKRKLLAEFASQSSQGKVSVAAGKYYCGDVEVDYDSLFENYLSNQTKYTTNKSQADEARHAKRLRTSDNEVVIRTTETTRYNIEGENSERNTVRTSDRTRDSYIMRRKSLERANGQESAKRMANQVPVYEIVTTTEQPKSIDRKSLTFQEWFDKCAKNCLENPSPVKNREDDMLTLNTSVFSLRDTNINFEALDSHRMYPPHVYQERLDERAKECVRGDLNMSIVKNKFLQDEDVLSDFDFDRNQLESEASIQSITGYKLKLCRFDQSEQSENSTKRQRVMEPEKIAFLESHLLLSDRAIPKLDIAKIRKLM